MAKKTEVPAPTPAPEAVPITQVPPVGEDGFTVA